MLRPLVQEIVHQVLEAELNEALGAEKGERTPHRQGQGPFRTEVFEQYQRSEKALVGAPTGMYVQGVFTQKVKAIIEELCGHEVSASTIRRLNEKLDQELALLY